MSTPNPSKEWKPEEKLAVIAWLADEMTIATATDGHVDSKHWLQRIKLVSLKDAEFLEHRRRYILQERGQPLDLIENWSLNSFRQFGPLYAGSDEFVADALNYSCSVDGKSCGQLTTFRLYGQASSSGRVVESLNASGSSVERAALLGEVDPQFKQWLKDQGIELDENNPIKTGACTPQTIAEDLFRAPIASGEAVPASVNRRASVKLQALDLWVTRQPGWFSLWIFRPGVSVAAAIFKEKVADQEVLMPERARELVESWLTDFVSKDAVTK